MTMLTSSFLCSRKNINSRIHKRWRLKAKIYDDVTRWDPTNYQWSYNLYKLHLFLYIWWIYHGVFIQYHANELLTPPFWSHLIAPFVTQLKWFNKQIDYQYHSIYRGCQWLNFDSNSFMGIGNQDVKFEVDDICTLFFKTIGSMYGKKYLHELIFLVTVGKYTNSMDPSWEGSYHIISMVSSPRHPKKNLLRWNGVFYRDHSITNLRGIKQCKWMVILRDCPLRVHCLGCQYNDPCFRHIFRGLQILVPNLRRCDGRMSRFW